MSKQEKNNSSNNEKDNIITPEIKKEINTLPKDLQKKKIEKKSLIKKQNLLRDKIKTIKKDLQKITTKIISNENEQESILNTKNNLKTKQNLIKNSITDEFYNEFIQKLFTIPENVRQIFLNFINFNETYYHQLKIILKSNVELLHLLTGSYSFIKMLRKDKEQKYIELKNKITNNLSKINNKSETIFPFNLIINYIQNCFLILENKEKIENIQKKEKQLSKIKEASFIKLKLLENQINENDVIINSINDFNKEANIILEKYKKYIRRNKSITNPNNCIQLSTKKSVGLFPGSNRNKNETKNINYFLTKTTNEQIDSSNSNADNNRYTNLTSNNYTNNSNSNYISGNLTNSDISSLNYDNYQYLAKDIYSSIKKLKTNKIFTKGDYNHDFPLKSNENKSEANHSIELSENIIKENKTYKNKKERNVMRVNTKNELNINKLNYYNPQSNKIVKKNSMTHLSLTEKYSPVKKYNGKIKKQQYIKVTVTKILTNSSNQTIESNKGKRLNYYKEKIQKDFSRSKNVIHNNYTMTSQKKEKNSIKRNDNTNLYEENIDEVGKISEKINQSVNNQLNSFKNSQKIIYINPGHNKTILSSANLKSEDINKSTNINLNMHKSNNNDQKTFIKISSKKFPYKTETAKKVSINRKVSRIIANAKTSDEFINQEINKTTIIGNERNLLKKREITRINLEYNFHHSKNRFKSPLPKHNKYFQKEYIIPINNENENNSKSNRVNIKYDTNSPGIITENFNKINLKSKNSNNLQNKINELLPPSPLNFCVIKNDINNSINKSSMSTNNSNRIRNKKYMINI